MLQDQIQIVTDLANKFYDPDLVEINTLRLPGIQDFKKNPKDSYGFSFGPENNAVFSLINASVQFSFFLGRSDYRPQGINGETVVQMLKKEFDTLLTNKKATDSDYKDTIDSFIDALKSTEITLIDERIQALKQVQSLPLDVFGYHYSNEDVMFRMMMNLDTFRKDVFKKKAFYALQTCSLLNNTSSIAPVPCDYQIPKVMYDLGILLYSNEIHDKIQNDEIFIRNSKQELSIRSACFKAAQQLQDIYDISPANLDQYLFLKKNTSTKHHLCYTTDY
jgi:hypothetical protein